MTDRPYAFDACFNNWLVVEGGDQRGIMAVLGLADAAPATYPLGETLTCHLAHGGLDRREERHGLSGPPERIQGGEAFADWALDCCAPAVAADLSIDPVWTGWLDQVQVEGQALIARTDAGKRQSALRGCHMARI